MFVGSSWFHRLMRRLSLAMMFQFSLTLGLLFCLLVSLFYVRVADITLPVENPLPLLVGIVVSGAISWVGWMIKPTTAPSQVNLSRGVQIVVMTWILACSISAIVYMVAGFPDPNASWETFSVWRRFVDGFFESMSGFTTAGGSILPSVEVFSRGILMWRSMTHLIGGMGIAYLTMTLFTRVLMKREELINAETDGPTIVTYDNEQEAISSGWDFIKIYGAMTLVCVGLLFVSGLLFRDVAYIHWYQSLFDALNFAFSVLGTGGFSPYDTSAGLPMMIDGIQVIGGARNRMSEWIMALFMMMAGANFGIWYSMFFLGKWKVFWNSEFQRYIRLLAFLLISISIIVVYHTPDASWHDMIRGVVFTVASIISTTGLATVDFSYRPLGAIALLMIAYLSGSCVGSTAGGQKILRFRIAREYCVQLLHNLVRGKDDHSFVIDGVRYTNDHGAIVVISLMMYFGVFLLLGTIVLMLVNPTFILMDGTVIANNFSTSFQAVLANVGNIGPTFQISGANTGPAGNYHMFNEVGKLLLSLLMMWGRIGILGIIFIFIDYQRSDDLDDTFGEIDFVDAEEGGIYLKK